MKSTHVLQPYTRQLAREIQEYARQCGFNLVPLNKIASQLEMAAARLEVSVRRGDHHYPGDGGKHHFEPKSCFRKGHSGIYPIFLGIFKNEMNGGCRDQLKKYDELLEEWPSAWVEQFMANAGKGLIGKGCHKIRKTLIQTDEDERHKERMLLEEDAEQAATDTEQETLEQ